MANAGCEQSMPHARTNKYDEKMDEVSSILKKLSVARKELQNIRNDLKTLNRHHQSDIENISSVIKTWKCEFCSASVQNNVVSECDDSNIENSTISFNPIGIVSTSFGEKRGIPRQSSICCYGRGKFTLLNTVFTNPEHALEGLHEFSHMWVLFHFHKNNNSHIKAKVSPPRLNGLRIGVFGTRSPHRPSPIGLSLVHIDRIDGATVYFSGVDMLDGTPVLDIKPYIPQYDNPISFENSYNLNGGNIFSSRNKLSDTLRNGDQQLIDPTIEPREAPDGQEDVSESSNSMQSATFTSLHEVRVPRWITDPEVARLDVVFSDKSKYDLKYQQMQDEDENSGTDIENIEKSIECVLQEDPRSVYVRDRYTNQFYTFLIGKYHITCKFDDVNHSVQVYRITRANLLLNEWKNSFDTSD